jgi:hypothetical protein
MVKEFEESYCALQKSFSAGASSSFLRAVDGISGAGAERKAWTGIDRAT